MKLKEPLAGFTFDRGRYFCILLTFFCAFAVKTHSKYQSKNNNRKKYQGSNNELHTACLGFNT